MSPWTSPRVLATLLRPPGHPLRQHCNDNAGGAENAGDGNTMTRRTLSLMQDGAWLARCRSDAIRSTIWRRRVTRSAKAWVSAS